MKTRIRFLKGALLALVLAGATGALAVEGLPKLPKAYQLPKHERSPGQVTFRHKTHVDAEKPDCTSCHPTLFKITEKGATADGVAISHKVMKKGGQCGACHTGGEKKAFGLDECDSCHISEDE